MNIHELLNEFGEQNSHPNTLLAFLVWRVKPKYVLELGTGEGNGTRAMMQELPRESKLVTINWPNPPSGDEVGKVIRSYSADRRLTQILGDTREVHDQIAPGIDFLYVDSGTDHVYSLVAEEWRLYEPKLADETICCFDDISVNDMPRFWDELPYDKIKTPINGGFGIVHYKRG